MVTDQHFTQFLLQRQLAQDLEAIPLKEVLFMGTGMKLIPIEMTAIHPVAPATMTHLLFQDQKGT